MTGIWRFAIMAVALLIELYPCLFSRAPQHPNNLSSRAASAPIRYRFMNELEFIDRCRSLAPVLAAHVQEGEEQRRIPDAVMETVIESRILWAIVPRSLGGEGLGLSAVCNGTRELAHGCPAMAWTISFLMLHAWMLARFPSASHDDLFTSGRLPRAAAPLAPTGTMIPVDGGFSVTGRWEWATGINNSDWCLVHGIDKSEGGFTRFAVVPVTSLTVEDVWFTSGMRATGSNVVVADGLFVEDRFTCTGDDVREGAGSLPDDPLAGAPLLSVLALVASASAVGAAQAAVALYHERLASRVLAYTLGDKAAEQPMAQGRLAAVTSDVASLTSAWNSTIAELGESDSIGAPDDLLRVRVRLAAAAAVRASRLAIGTIGEGAGASVYALSHPLQRLQRDVETLKGHVIFDWDRTTELAGRIMLGGKLGPIDMA